MFVSCKPLAHDQFGSDRQVQRVRWSQPMAPTCAPPNSLRLQPDTIALPTCDRSEALEHAVSVAANEFYQEYGIFYGDTSSFPSATAIVTSEPSTQKKRSSSTSSADVKASAWPTRDRGFLTPSPLCPIVPAPKSRERSADAGHMAKESQLRKSLTRKKCQKRATASATMPYAVSPGFSSATPHLVSDSHLIASLSAKQTSTASSQIMAPFVPLVSSTPHANGLPEPKAYAMPTAPLPFSPKSSHWTSEPIVAEAAAVRRMPHARKEYLLHLISNLSDDSPTLRTIVQTFQPEALRKGTPGSNDEVDLLDLNDITLQKIEAHMNDRLSLLLKPVAVLQRECKACTPTTTDCSAQLPRAVGHDVVPAWPELEPACAKKYTCNPARESVRGRSASSAFQFLRSACLSKSKVEGKDGVKKVSPHCCPTDPAIFGS